MLSTLLFDFLNVYVFEKASKVDTVSRACSDTLKLQNNFRMLKRLNIIRLIIKKSCLYWFINQMLVHNLVLYIYSVLMRVMQDTVGYEV